MNVLLALAIVLALVVIATALGLLWRARNGRVHTAATGTSSETVVTAAEVGSAVPFGEDATLLQFSTEFCAKCPATRVLLGKLAHDREGVTYVDVDLTDRADLAKRFNILQTPTTFLLDGAGTVRARIGGAPRREELIQQLDDILGSGHVQLIN